jgi:signal transduction histidine kinase/DNA-binding response OmpR family regulator
MFEHDGKVNILLVDDKPQQLLALESILEEPRQNIVRAYSGTEALRKILQEEFAVILLDVNMPGMDGFETASLIRQRKATEHVPIIFVTAFGDEAQISKGYGLGAVDYILTPVIPDILKTKVAVFVDLYRKTAQIQRQAEWLRRRAAQLHKLTAASVAINSATSIAKLLQMTTDTARDIVGSHQAITLFVYNDTSTERPPRTTACTSFSEKYIDWRNRRLTLDPIANTVVARSRSATRLTMEELRKHPDWEVVKSVEIPPVVGGIVAAPLTSRDGTNLGVIYLTDPFDGVFSNDDEAVLVQLAQMASVAIENSMYAEERETNRIKDEFLSTLSHELRTPLNAILGWTQLLHGEQSSSEIEHGLDVVERNAKAQSKLIEDLLDVSRISTGKLRINPRGIKLRSVISSAVEACRPNAEAKGIEVGMTIEIEDDAIVGDPDRLQQVVWNLLNNSVKFTGTGGQINVALDRSNGQMRVRVSDTGKGISSKFLPFVFDRFRQADSTSTRSHGGLGIGLTIVRHIVELHGGTVHADSAGEGHGSTFTVHLPPAPITATGNGSAGNGEPANLHRRSDAPPSLAGVHVLMIDDEADAREVISETLKRSHARVTTAGSVKEGLEAFMRETPDVVLSDIAMPDRDGYDLIRTLRELPPLQGGDVPAIALTAYAREEDRLAALSAGFQIHLAKPVEPGELISSVAHLAFRRAGAPAAQLNYG